MNNRRGFSITEILVGMLLILLIAGGILEIYFFCEKMFLTINSQVFANRESRIIIEKIMRIVRNANWSQITYMEDGSEELQLRWDNHIPMTITTNDDIISAFYFIPGNDPENSVISYDPDIASAGGPDVIGTGVQKALDNNGNDLLVFSETANKKLLLVNFVVQKKHEIIPYQTAMVSTAIDMRND